MMKAEVVAQEGSRVALQITVDIGGSLLAAEETILEACEACNALGCRATAEARRRFDTDGSPIVMGAEKWTAKCRDRRVYQNPFGPVEIECYRYQSSCGATPRFAKLLSHWSKRRVAGGSSGKRSINMARLLPTEDIISRQHPFDKDCANL